MEQSKKNFLKNIVGFSMTAWISFVIGFIASPIATRLFIPAELGKINLFNTYAALFGAICYLGLDQALVRFYLDPPAKSNRASLITFCAATSLAFSILSSLLLMFGWRFVSEQVMGTPDFGVFLCLCLFSFCTVMFRYLSLIYRMEQNAKLYTIQGVVHIVLTKIAYLSVAFSSAYAKPAILALTALMAVITFSFAMIQRKRFVGHFLQTVNKPFVKEISVFAAPLIPVTIISWMNSSMSAVMLRNLMDIASVGIYTAAVALASTVNVIQTGFNTYWAPYVYEQYKKGETSRFFTVHRLMACLLAGFGLTVTLLQAIVFLLLGESFRESVIFFPFLFLAPICYCLGETTDMGIGIKKKTYWNTIVFAISVLLNVALCYILIPVMGATGAAIASAAAAIIAVVLRTVIGQHYFKAIQNYRYVVYTIGLMLSASVANYILRDNDLLKYTALLSVYGVALFLFREEIVLLWNTLRQIIKEGLGALKIGGRA